MMSPIKTTLICIGVISVIGAQSNENRSATRISSIQLAEGLNTGDGEGFYADVLTAIIQGMRFRPTIQIQPLKRALLDFEEKRVDCIWPVDRNLMDKLIGHLPDTIESDYVFEARQHIFTAPGKPAISSLTELAGKSVGVTIGSNVEQLLRDASAIVDPVPLQDNKVSMLIAGHLFAIVGWAPDFLITFHDLNHEPPAYDKSLILTQTGNAFVCHKAPKTIKFINSINGKIKPFRNSEKFKEITNKYGIASAFELGDINN